MITKNLKAVMKMLPFCMGIGNKSVAGAEVVNVSNVTYYLTGYLGTSNYPYSVNTSYTASATSAGVSFGKGTTASTGSEYNLESTITSGLTVNTISTQRYSDADGYIYSEFVYSVANSSSDAITISEVGWKAQMYAYSTVDSTSNGTSYVFLMDRTVLDEPITIAAGDVVKLVYRIQNEISFDS